jgi:hypothetical protein
MAHRGPAKIPGADDRPSGRKPGGFTRDPGLVYSERQFGGQVAAAVTTEAGKGVAIASKFAAAERAATLAKVGQEAEEELNTYIQFYLDGIDSDVLHVQKNFKITSEAMLKKYSDRLSGANKTSFETSFNRAAATGAINIQRDTRGKFVKVSTATFNKLALSDAQKAATDPLYILNVKAREVFLNRPGGARDTLRNYVRSGIFDPVNGGQRMASLNNSVDRIAAANEFAKIANDVGKAEQFALKIRDPKQFTSLTPEARDTLAKAADRLVATNRKAAVTKADKEERNKDAELKLEQARTTGKLTAELIRDEANGTEFITIAHLQLSANIAGISGKDHVALLKFKRTLDEDFPTTTETETSLQIARQNDALTMDLILQARANKTLSKGDMRYYSGLVEKKTSAEHKLWLGVVHTGIGAGLDELVGIPGFKIRKTNNDNVAQQLVSATRAYEDFISNEKMSPRQAADAVLQQYSSFIPTFNSLARPVVSQTGEFMNKDGSMDIDGAYAATNDFYGKLIDRAKAANDHKAADNNYNLYLQQMLLMKTWEVITQAHNDLNASIKKIQGRAKP